MSDLNPKSVYSAYREDQKAGPLARPLFLARILAISVACLGAIPTGYNLYQSWQHGIPYSQVSHRLEQYELWVKNFECKIDYSSVGTGKGTKVDVGACPKSGDIALKLTTPAGKATYEWIAFDQLEKATQQASLLSLFVTEAQAEELHKAQGSTATAGTVSVGGIAQLAQSTPGTGMKVICEVMPEKGKILRIVSEGGKCYREHVSAFQGRMEKREEVPCSTQCAPGKG